MEDSHGDRETGWIGIAAAISIGAVVAALALMASTQKAEESAVGPPSELRLLTDADGRPEAIAAVGLDRDALARLATRRPNDEAWRELFAVDAAGSHDMLRSKDLAVTETRVDGEWVVEDDAVVFYPDRPFSRGTHYAARWGAPGAGPTLQFRPELEGARSEAVVTAVYPSSDLIPYNLERLEIETSKPMSRERVLEHVRLLSMDGESVALEPDEACSWSEDGTRLSVLLSGSSKDGGRSILAPGRKYRLVVDRGWRDARGHRLARGEERLFLTREADHEAPALSACKIQEPPSPRAPVVVDLPEPFSRGTASSLESALEVVELEGRRVVEGAARVSNDETRWSFVPKQPWRPGVGYAIRIDGRITDLAGNPLAAEGPAARGGNTQAPSAVLPFKVQDPSAAGE